MSQFKKNLATLPSVDHVESLTVLSKPVLVIENKPGKSGSLAVYYFLNKEFGELTVDAATRGLVLFGEYTEEAKQKSGSHPNIDFLFSIIESDAHYKISVIEKS